MPIWLGIQHKWIFLWAQLKWWSFSKSFKINGLSSFILCSDKSTESESEKIIKWSSSLSVIASSAKSIAVTSAVKMEALLGNLCLKDELSIIVPHPTLSLSFDPSV